MRILAYATGFGGVAVRVTCEGSFSLDAGVPVKEEDVVLSHAHLDHSRYAPGKRVYATLPTLALSRVLLNDAKSLDPSLPWEVQDLQRSLAQATFKPYGSPFTLKGATITFYNASHILGSSMIKVECGSKELLYTGDLGTSSFLLDHWNNNVPKVENLIIEGSYMCEDRPSAKKEWAKFYSYLKQSLREGPILVATNAVGKAQEVLKFLMNHSDSLPLKNVVLEGMAVDATKVYDDMLEYLSRSEIMSWLNGSRKKLMDFVVVPKTLGERKSLAKPGTVVVAPSGSLSGGMSVWWALKGIRYVTMGHLFEPASKLLQGERVEVVDPLGNKGFIDKPDLHLKISRHASRQELFNFISKSKAKRVFLFHGDEECLRSVAEEYGFEVLEEGREVEL